MPKDRERTVNPATAHLKSQKAAALKKSKAAVTAQRTERLSKRNPDRLQRQIEELKQLQEAQGGTLRPREKQELEKLERDIKAIQKARGGDGASAPTGQGTNHRGDGGERGGRGGRGGSNGSMLGKRRRDDNRDFSHDAGNESDSTDPEVRDIPMPRDTPPPIPPRRFRNPRDAQPRTSGSGTGANSISVPSRPGAPQAAPAPAQTTYEAAPQIRDLRKEATSKFVPAVVAARLKASKGGNVGGRYLEPEEVDRLEADGYLGDKEGKKVDDGKGQEGKNGQRSLEEEEEAFERELRETEERERLVREGREDAEMAAEEAVKEAVADEMVKNQGGEMGEAQVERRLRHVEMEEVEDEDG